MLARVLVLPWRRPFSICTCQSRPPRFFLPMSIGNQLISERGDGSESEMDPGVMDAIAMPPSLSLAGEEGLMVAWHPMGRTRTGSLRTLAGASAADWWSGRRESPGGLATPDALLTAGWCSRLDWTGRSPLNHSAALLLATPPEQC